MVQRLMEEKIGPYSCRIVSTVDFVKEIAARWGWDGTKTPQNRKFLSDLSFVVGMVKKILKTENFYQI